MKIFQIQKYFFQKKTTKTVLSNENSEQNKSNYLHVPAIDENLQKYLFHDSEISNEKEIGRGSQGIVFLSKFKERKVARKIINDEESSFKIDVEEVILFFLIFFF